MNALEIVKQVQAELGLSIATSIQTSGNTIDVQLMALLNSAGNELVEFYPWEQLTKEWTFETVSGQAGYALPEDYSYFLQQTQWDRNNHWPLMGPRTAQQWQWVKSGLISQGPRLRYRIQGNQFLLQPTPGDSGTGTATPWTMAMEYVSKWWVSENGDNQYDKSMVTKDTDVMAFDDWLLVKFIKLKFYESKGFDTTAYRDDFLNTFLSRTGKNMGGQVLSLAPRTTSIYIGINNIPDGSWPVGSTS